MPAKLAPAYELVSSVTPDRFSRSLEAAGKSTMGGRRTGDEEDYSLNSHHDHSVYASFPPALPSSSPSSLLRSLSPVGSSGPVLDNACALDRHSRAVNDMDVGIRFSTMALFPFF